METIELNVAGMTCEGCERSIARALERIPGVLAVAASHPAGTVIVDSEGPLDPDAVREAVEGAGYDVVPPGRKSLPIRPT